LFALICGLIVGCGAALVLDILDNTYSTPDEIQQSLGLPVLGVVPLFKLEGSDQSESSSSKRGKADIEQEIPTSTELTKIQTSTLSTRVAAFGSPASIASEAFRTIRTGILLSFADKQPGILLFTSGKKSEGKTTIATNIAVSLCQLGKRVLIIDADLRRPALHHSFKQLEGQPGLVDYLTGQASLEDVILPCPVSGLFSILAGSIPPNPAELVGSKKMADMLTGLAKEFDHVLIDAPPLLPVTDSVLLSRLVDGVILVVRGEDTPRHVAQEARSKLLKVGAKILGVVLNDVDFERGDYYYYYRDSYSYYEKDANRKKRYSVRG